eukprot:366429-Chlamydomonas_euryale.AAC.10
MAASTGTAVLRGDARAERVGTSKVGGHGCQHRDAYAERVGTSKVGDHGCQHSGRLLRGSRGRES